MWLINYLWKNRGYPYYLWVKYGPFRHPLARWAQWDIPDSDKRELIKYGFGRAAFGINYIKSTYHCAEHGDVELKTRKFSFLGYNRGYTVCPKCGKSTVLQTQVMISNAP